MRKVIGTVIVLRVTLIGRDCATKKDTGGRGTACTVVSQFDQPGMSRTFYDFDSDHPPLSAEPLAPSI